MDDFVAYRSPLRIALMILASAVFVAGGLAMAGVWGPALSSDRYSPEYARIVGWFSAVFFGACGVMGIKLFFDPPERLRIGPAGIRFAAWSDETIPWSQITDVTTWSYKRQRTIILRLRDRTRFPGRGLAGLLAGVNRNLTGGDISMSLTTTNRSLDEALAAIALYRSVAA